MNEAPLPPAAAKPDPAPSPVFPGVVPSLAGAICILVWIGVTATQSGLSAQGLQRWGWAPPFDVWRGKLWPLVTSAFLHVDVVHLALNLYWLWKLGPVFEKTLGRWWAAAFIIGTAAFTSLTQMVVSDDMGIGFSGVGYAIFGFLWVARRWVPAARALITPKLAGSFIVWLVWCWLLTRTKSINVGNTAHASGLVLGAGLSLFRFAPKRRWLTGTGLALLTALGIAGLFYAPWSQWWTAIQGQDAWRRRDYASSKVWFRRSLERGGDAPWCWTWIASCDAYLDDWSAVQYDLEMLREDTHRSEVITLLDAIRRSDDGGHAALVDAVFFDAGTTQAPSDSSRRSETETSRTAREAIGRFWTWWEGARPKYETAVGSHVSEDLQAELSERVKAIHPEMTWELGHEPGRFVLTLSGEGNFPVRKLAGTWVASAPAERHGWTFTPSRPGNDGHPVLLKYQGQNVDLAQMSFSTDVDSSRARVNVGVYHPAFKAMTSEVRTGAMFIALDTLLGEDDVERWVGAVEALNQRPKAGKDPAAFVRAVRSLAPASGSTEPQYSMLEGKTDAGTPMMAMLALGLKRLDHLQYEWHLEVVIPYAKTSANGLPEDESLREGRALEDELLEALKASALSYGHVIQNGQLRVGFYSQSREATNAAYVAWATKHPDRNIAVEWALDPNWERLSRH